MNPLRPQADMSSSPDSNHKFLFAFCLPCSGSRSNTQDQCSLSAEQITSQHSSWKEPYTLTLSHCFCQPVGAAELGGSKVSGEAMLKMSAAVSGRLHWGEKVPSEVACSRGRQAGAGCQ